MEFRILGPLEVRAQAGSLTLGGVKQRALLAVLLLHANEVVSTDRLIDDLWGDSPPATAAHTIQVYVSNLRKALEDEGRRRLVTRAPGYVLELDEGQLDLDRFERLTEEARRALADGAPEAAAEQLRSALALWRGEPLADFTYEPFAQAALSRLAELRLAALEERVEADLRCGRHAELVGELEAYVAEHPLRERLCGQLMLALYRSARQAEALEVYQDTRRLLVDDLGIDPSSALQRLERAILSQDPELELSAAPAAELPSAPPVRAILVVTEDDALLDAVLELAAPLAGSRALHELIAARVVPRGDDLTRATSSLNARRSALLEEGVTARVAAFTSSDPGADLVRFATRENVDLMLLSTDIGTFDAATLPEQLELVLAEAPCDVGLVVLPSEPSRETAQRPVLVPFGGGEHEWAALELGAWFASARGVPLCLLGSAGDDDRSRDASRLLAHASLAVQQLVGIAAEPLLEPPGTEGVLEATERAAVVVAGLPDTWRQSGLGTTRSLLVRSAPVPIVFVRRGLRPGGLAPEESLTRFTWSIATPPHE